MRAQGREVHSRKTVRIKEFVKARTGFELLEKGHTPEEVGDFLAPDWNEDQVIPGSVRSIASPKGCQNQTRHGRSGTARVYLKAERYGVTSISSATIT